jgi:hypothetical protein
MPMRGKGLRSTTRVQMTEALFAAHRAGMVRAVSVRAADLFGAYVTQQGEQLDAWLEPASSSGFPELVSFASGIKRD